MSNLEKALSGLLKNDELTAVLALVLAYASKTGRISYSKVTEIVGENPEEVLLLGNRWRLFLPVKVEKSGAWEDRLLLCKPGESYVLPNIVRDLVQNASRTGCWASMKAIAEVFKETGEPAWQQMPELAAELWREARDGQVSAVQIKETCTRAGLGDRVDVLIAELKSTGVMSPKLGSLAEVSRATSPIYELNPSLFVKRGDTE
jgi:hypothetical protein